MSRPLSSELVAIPKSSIEKRHPKKKNVFLCLIQRRGGSKEIEAGNLKFLPSLREASSEQEEPEPSQWLGDLRNFWEVFVSQVTGVDVIFFIDTPWKINRWFPQQWRFGSDQPSDFCWCISICVVVWGWLIDDI